MANYNYQEIWNWYHLDSFNETSGAYSTDFTWVSAIYLGDRDDGNLSDGTTGDGQETTNETVYWANQGSPTTIVGERYTGWTIDGGLVVYSTNDSTYYLYTNNNSITPPAAGTATSTPVYSYPDQWDDDTFIADHMYALPGFNDSTGAYSVGSDTGAHAIGDDQADLNLANGSNGDSTESDGELLAMETVGEGTDFVGFAYSGWTINGDPVIKDTTFGDYFLLSDSGGLTGNSGTATSGNYTYPVCLLPGTLIATPSGERAVETLQGGDLVLTASGATKPVKWLGRMSIPLTRFNRETATPICLRAGSLDYNLPRRDLYVSADHALYLDGVLVNAGVLVNGETIFRCMDHPGELIEYFQIELDDHDLILAEGAATETFLEDGDNRAKFDNAAEFHALFPDHTPILPMPCGRVSNGRQMPLTLRARITAGGRRVA